ncbi:MFS transporter [Gordonia soli]|uniref:Putative major facilitator superfamily transporter n=1 Tax=Gordonia soli NBRC 108243 TaxID=1223545 RepID=M0QHM5_9ACTN|nr:MFS transporter [Gordonia soli]GAC66902.1 putative major facilitator superfamily transporter [Gordonia soli NBRC 108243]
MTDTRPAVTRRAVPSRLILLLGALMLAYMVNSLNKIVFPLVVDDIRVHFDLTLGQAGLQSTIFALGVGLAGIPGGFLLSRFKRKTIIVVGTLTFSVATVLTAFGIGFWSMLVTQTIAGVGEALQVTALLVVAAAALPNTPSAAVGSLNVVYGISAIIGPVVATQLLSTFGTWRAPLIALAIVGVLAAILVTLLVPTWLTERNEDDDREVAAAAVETEDVSDANVPDGLWNHNTRVLVGVGVIASIVSFGYFGMYPTFLKEHHGFSTSTVGIIVSIAGTGALLSILGGFLTDRFDPRAVLVGSQLAMAAIGAALYAGPGSFAWQLAWAIAGGVVSNGIIFVNMSAVLLKSVTPARAAQAAGLFVVCWFTPGAISGYIFGELVDLTSWSGAGLIQLTLGSLVAAAGFALLRPDRLRVSGPLARKRAARAVTLPDGASAAGSHESTEVPSSDEAADHRDEEPARVVG